MSEAELEALSTRQLLARLRLLHQCEESLVLSDRDSNDDSGCIEFKQTPEWTAAHAQLKQTLSRREHVPKGEDLDRRRTAKAHAGRGLERRAGR